MIAVLSNYNNSIAEVIKTPVIIKDPISGKTFQTEGVWDTGATKSAITSDVASDLGLVLVSMINVSGVHGSEPSPVYNVNLTLNNQDISLDVRVTGAKVPSFSKDGLAKVLIGMDVISQGDFCISNYQGKTVMSFRVPPIERIDYVEELKTIMKYYQIHDFNIKKGLKDKCPCGSGRDFKNCHGKSPYMKDFLASQGNK